MWASCFINTNAINNINYFLLISGSNKETSYTLLALIMPALIGKILGSLAKLWLAEKRPAEKRPAEKG